MSAAAKLHPPRRERNGRPQRKTAQDRLNEANAADVAREVATGLAQPHRRGNGDPMCECAVGRFILQYALERELYGAALHFAKIRALWLAFVEAPMADHDGPGSGEPIDQETANGWRDDVADWRKAMKEAGGNEGRALIEWMACDGVDIPPNGNRLAAMVALRALGKTMGHI